MLSTVGDILSPVGVFITMAMRRYHDTSGGYHDTVGVFSTMGDIIFCYLSTMGDIMIHVEGYHDYCGECSVLWKYSNNQRLTPPPGTRIPHMYRDISHGTQDILPHLLGYRY